MGNYRLYSVDGAGKIIRMELLCARSDDEAVDLARALKKGACEVWNRTKLVQTIPDADDQGQRESTASSMIRAQVRLP